jgi:hypothetical protein
MAIRPDGTSKKEPSIYASLRQNIDDKGNLIPNEYILKANKNNKIGKIVLVATYNGVEYTKTVDIISLW